MRITISVCSPVSSLSFPPDFGVVFEGIIEDGELRVAFGTKYPKDDNSFTGQQRSHDREVCSEKFQHDLRWLLGRLGKSFPSYPFQWSHFSSGACDGVIAIREHIRERDEAEARSFDNAGTFDRKIVCGTRELISCDSIVLPFRQDSFLEAWGIAVPPEPEPEITHSWGSTPSGGSSADWVAFWDTPGPSSWASAWANALGDAFANATAANTIAAATAHTVPSAVPGAGGLPGWGAPLGGPILRRRYRQSHPLRRAWQRGSRRRIGKAFQRLCAFPSLPHSCPRK